MAARKAVHPRQWEAPSWSRDAVAVAAVVAVCGVCTCDLHACCGIAAAPAHGGGYGRMQYGTVHLGSGHVLRHKLAGRSFNMHGKSGRMLLVSVRAVRVR